MTNATPQRNDGTLRGVEEKSSGGNVHHGESVLRRRIFKPQRRNRPSRGTLRARPSRPGPLSCSGLSSLYCGSDISALCAQSKERPKQQIDRYRGVSGLHLRDAGLAGAQALRQRCLGYMLRSTAGAKTLAQGKLRFHKGGFLWRQLQEVRRRANSPAMRFQTCALAGLHHSSRSFVSSS